MSNTAPNGTNWTAQQNLARPDTVNSGTVAWAATTAFTAGQVVTLAGGDKHLCVTAGTSGSGPTWATTFGGSTTDGGVTWKLVGQSQFDGYKIKGQDYVNNPPVRNDFILEVKPA